MRKYSVTVNKLLGVEIIRFALLIVLAFTYNKTKSQTCDTLAMKFPGSVILRSERKKDIPGSIKHGCIEKLGWQEMFVAPKLIDASGKTERFFGREALAYWYIRNNDTIYYLNAGRHIKLYKWIYLERVVCGTMELYYFKMQGTSLLTLSRSEYRYYYFRKGGNWLNKKAIVWNEGDNRKQLQKIFSDCNPALELISKTSTLQLDEIFIQLVAFYNNSKFGK